MKVNSSPAVADDLLDGLVDGLVKLQFEDYFLPSDQAATGGGGGGGLPLVGAGEVAVAAQGDIGGWELLHAGGLAPLPETPFPRTPLPPLREVVETPVE